MRTFATSILLFFVIIAYSQLKPVENGVYHWENFPVSNSSEATSKKLLKGKSPHFEYLSIQAIIQSEYSKIKAPISEKALETIVIVKAGIAKVTLDNKSTIIGETSVALVMPKDDYTIENIGDSKLTYYLMSYRSKKVLQIERGETHGGSTVFNADSLVFKPSKRGGGIAYFDRPTAMCERFEMHITQLDKKGPSHKPHTHIETEIILVVSGKAEMTINEKKYQGVAGDFFFANSNALHGIENMVDEPCKYFAFKWY